MKTRMNLDRARWSRRDALAGLAALGFLPALPALATPRLGRAEAFSWEGLKQQAMALSERPFVPLRRVEAAAAVDYDALNAIRYRDSAALWPDRPGQSVRLFPLGKYAREPVAIHLVESGRARSLSYSPDLYDMPQDSPARALTAENGGFAGFRVMNPGNVGDWLAFQGASYFRTAGPLHQYGLSARGLAIDTGLSTPEEFPMFRAFWLEPGEDAFTVYALLDGPRVAGAYRFVNRVIENEIVQEVTLSVRLRADVERLGFAPMTSMYWYGETEPGPRRDWRPEIHDSDGLLIANGAGERLWRPLVNPPRTALNAFLDKNPRGFGLMQRDRNYDNYEDDGVFYHKRPSLWAEPIGDWGEGTVDLVEIPTRGETDDNIAAFWQPKAPARAGMRYDLAYRLRWLGGEPDASPLARVIGTYRGLGGRPGHPAQEDVLKLVVDFEGESLKGRAREEVTAQVDTNGEILMQAAYPVAERSNRWRLMIDVAPRMGVVTDLRGALVCCGAQLTETWLYQVPTIGNG
jgi:periplasmic glucans biosynthesis protein